MHRPANSPGLARSLQILDLNSRSPGLNLLANHVTIYGEIAFYNVMIFFDIRICELLFIRRYKSFPSPFFFLFFFFFLFLGSEMFRVVRHFAFGICFFKACYSSLFFQSQDLRTWGFGRYACIHRSPIMDSWHTCIFIFVTFSSILSARKTVQEMSKKQKSRLLNLFLSFWTTSVKKQAIILHRDTTSPPQRNQSLALENMTLTKIQHQMNDRQWPINNLHVE